MQTSFRSDAVRIQKEMTMSSFPGRYSLDTPGPGLEMPMMDEPQIRMQTWGANRHDNFVNLESDLRGMTRRMNRVRVDENQYKSHAVASQPVRDFRVQDPFVLESRASHPAWTFRDREQDRWEQPRLNPQAPVDKDFYDNVQTRLLEKDYYSGL